MLCLVFLGFSLVGRAWHGSSKQQACIKLIMMTWDLRCDRLCDFCLGPRLLGQVLFQNFPQPKLYKMFEFNLFLESFIAKLLHLR